MHAGEKLTQLDSQAPLADWLAYLETIHPVVMDLGLERVARVRDTLGLRFDCPVITVGGTNGKGSTCAFLESILMQAGYRVGVYSSPHLVEFNERARLDGANATDAALTEQFAAVEAARLATRDVHGKPISLTYFEFSTLAILRLFAHARLDAVILEVGLGGRLDAVNAIDADCAIVASVDIDHQEYLGDTREKIGWEKAHIFRTGRPAICSDPVPPTSLVDYARDIGADLRLFGRDFNYSGDQQQWAYAGRSMRRSGLAYPALRGANQLLNACGALAALEALADRLPVNAQAVRNGFAMVELPGRFQVLPGRPTVVLDVAHNPHAAAALANNLDGMAYHPYTYAVFGCMRDKDIAGVVRRFKDRVDHWHLADLPGPRAASAEEIEAIVRAHGYVDDADHTITRHASVAEAFDAARGRAGEGDRICAFGSFLVVGGVMQHLATRRSRSNAVPALGSD